MTTPPRPATNAQARRRLLQAGGLVLLLGPAELVRAQGATIVAVRVWPAKDYTRVTIESDAPLKTSQTFVANPPRLAVDIEGIQLNPALRELVGKVRSDDPYITGVRVGQYSANTVRLVLDLRQMVQPQVFSLPPVQVGNARYQNRLVFDLYPTQVADPLEALIAERTNGGMSTHQPNTPPNAPSMTPGPAPAQASKLLSNNSDPLGDLIAGRRPAPTSGTSTATSGNPTSTAPVASPQGSGAPGSTAPGNAVANNATTSGASAVGNTATATAAVPAGTVNADSGTAGSRAADTNGAMERIIIVALDPGHGGEDPGATGSRGTHEKDVVLQIAHKLRERINAASVRTRHGTLPMRAYLTRDADFFVPLQMRVEKARRVQADLFVSIHADAFITPQAKGASVFALSQGGASSTAARWMAKQENRADLVGGLNIKSQDATVQRALLDMSTTAQINDSLKLGGEMLGQIRRIGKLHKGSVEQAGFAVLKAPDIPSVLVETAFISNPEEELHLLDEDYQNRLADALMRGIERYFARNPPLARSRST